MILWHSERAVYPWLRFVQPCPWPLPWITHIDAVPEAYERTSLGWFPPLGWWPLRRLHS